MNKERIETKQFTKITVRQKIQESLKNYATCSLLEGSLQILDSLGYSNEPSILDSPTFDGFVEMFPFVFDPVKLYKEEWKEVQTLFDFQPENVSDLFLGGKINNREIKGFLFIAVELKKKEYNKSVLVSIVRELNRPIQIPVLVLFRYNKKFTLAVIDRRESKSKDSVKREFQVLEKVSLIQNIDLPCPHRAHIEILYSLHLDIIKETNKINHFVDLYNAWRRALDTKELNLKFYKDIANWFYWARKEIKLPIIPIHLRNSKKKKQEQEIINTTNFLIRLICRTIFAWFVKEKDALIDPVLLELYDEKEEIRILIQSKNKKKFWEENSYYRGILQNIFFSCLNQKMNFPKGRKKETYLGKNYLPNDFDYKLFDFIPYMNGGLFDALEEDNWDDSIDDKKIQIPNKLFYARKEDGYVLEEGKKKIPLEGLNRILSNYKFTISENSSLEEEVALDPELLGLVFENLLAEVGLDEDTQKSARKASGSFYTPRKIIDYIVNESLRIYLDTKLKQRNFTKQDRDCLILLLYNNQFVQDNLDLASAIVEELESIKILDPACGSGAFPMGALNRILEILRLVDPSNKIWISIQVQKVESSLRKGLEKSLNSEPQDYVRKLGLIKNAIYGVDIQPIAILITKLRFFISLLVDQRIQKDCPKENYSIEPLPNLDTKILCGNTLKELRTSGIFENTIFERYKADRIEYFHESTDPSKREKLLKTLAEDLDILYPKFGEELTGITYKSEKDRKTANILHIQDWICHSSLPAPFFSFDLFFPEINLSSQMSDHGFDLVIGNPPYGGTKIKDEVQEDLGITSKDPYSAFISRFLGDGFRKTPLCPNGVLAFIVSDTFMTIKSHKILREQILNHRIHKMIRVHPDTFRATVNTAIVLVQKQLREESEKIKSLSNRIVEDQIVLMADLTNISIHDNHEQFLDLLYRTQGTNVNQQISTEYCAIYTYPQKLICTNSNNSFFVASPKLFALMNDLIPTSKKSLDGKQIEVRTIEMNGKQIEVTKLSQIAEVKQGLATGDNDSYLFQNPKARGNYRSIEEYKDFLVTESDLEIIRTNEKLRLEIIENGISKTDKKSNRYFGGRYIVPYDKGGESDSSKGWLPNYFVPTDYFIDWSEWSVNRLKNYTIADRMKYNEETKNIKIHYNTTPCAVFRNTELYFNNSFTFSRTGVYSPSFRLSSNSIFDSEGSIIKFNTKESIYISIAKLSSKLIKYLVKNFIGNTVHTQVEELKELNYIIQKIESTSLVNSIIEKQKQNPRYDYASNEQIEIDRLVYEAYGLNLDDILEVENWYARRYPKLVAAQKEKSKELNRDNYSFLDKISEYER